jgi:hypothetical protein
MTETAWLDLIRNDPRWAQAGTFVVKGIAVNRAPGELD